MFIFIIKKNFLKKIKCILNAVWIFLYQKVKKQDTSHSWINKSQKTKGS